MFNFEIIFIKFVEFQAIFLNILVHIFTYYSYCSISKITTKLLKIIFLHLHTILWLLTFGRVRRSERNIKLG